LWIDRRCREESPTEKLLNSGSVPTGLAAATVCKVDEVNSVDVNNGKGLGARLGVRTVFGRMVTELEEITCLSERGFFKVRSVPLLFLNVRNTRKNLIVLMDLPLLHEED